MIGPLDARMRKAEGSLIDQVFVFADAVTSSFSMSGPERRPASREQAKAGATEARKALKYIDVFALLSLRADEVGFLQEQSDHKPESAADMAP